MLYLKGTPRTIAMNLPHQFSITVQFEEVDSYRIAHHTKLIAFVERARVDLFRQLGIEIDGVDYAIVLHALNVRFMAPARLLDSLLVQTRVVSADALRIILVSRIEKKSQLICKADCELAFADMHTGGVIPTPQAVLKALAHAIDTP
jgi:YbgC/YbaW family acyl-CoA thioester hydrolase